MCVFNIDKALGSGDYKSIMKICEIEDFKTLFSNELESSHQLDLQSASSGSALRESHSELQLLTTHAVLINDYEQAIADYMLFLSAVTTTKEYH